MTLNAITRADSIFRLLFGLALLPALLLAASNPAGASCPPYPEVTWWNNLTHQKTIQYVNKNHGGDWSSYLTKWERQLARVTAIMSMDKGIRIPSTGMTLKGSQLSDYVSKLKQRIDVNRCLSMQVKNGSILTVETPESEDVPDGEEAAELDGEAAPEIPPDESDLASLPELSNIELLPELEAEPELQPNTFEDAVNAFNAGNYKTAIKVLRPLAKDGMVDAQNALGYLYRNGLGVEKDLLQSMFWYQKSARLGDAVGQYSLGEITRKEGRTKVQQAVALEWITKAANQNYADAQYTLGVVFFQGNNIPQDVPHAYFWLSLGMQNEHAKSMRLFNHVETLVDEDMKLEQDLRVRDWLSNMPVAQ